MKLPKKKKSPATSAVSEEEDNRPLRFEALAELTSSEVIQEVKDGLSAIDPVEFEDQFGDEPSA